VGIVTIPFLFEGEKKIIQALDGVEQISKHVDALLNSKLIAANHSVEEIAELIGADSLGYLSLSDVEKLADQTAPGFCTACFGGEYATSIPSGGKDRFEKKISENEEDSHA